MPIEIRELIISARVDKSRSEKSKIVGKGKRRKEDDTVKNAVEEVMRILKKKNDR